MLTGAAERNGKDAVINEVLFSVGTKSFTSRDHLVYKSVLNEVFQKTRISQFTKRPVDDFLLSRLSYNEAIAFELAPEKPKLRDQVRKKLSEFSLGEIEREREIIAAALALIDIKEAQVKNQGRFNTWFDLLKRKYQLKLKSPEAK